MIERSNSLEIYSSAAREKVAYSSEIAPTGHTPAQEPQLMQTDPSISNLPSPSEIAPTGHCPAQEPQEIHASLITYAIT